MGAPEKEIFREYLEALDGSYQRRFRVVSVSAWVGKARRLPNGDVVLRGARRVRTCEAGMFDFIGWDSVVITPEMVGQTVAIFAGDEVKSEHDRLSKFQRMLGECLKRMGGHWKVVKASSPCELPHCQEQSSRGP